MSGNADGHDDPVLEVAASVRGRGVVDFTRHALDRMEERGITSDEVIDALRHPDQEGLPADPPRLRIRRLLGSIALDVVFVELPDRIRVVTTYVRRPRLSAIPFGEA